MKVLHVTESHSKAAGGVTTVLNDLTKNLNDYGVGSYVLADNEGSEEVPDGVKFYNIPMPSRLVCCFKFGQQVKKIQHCLDQQSIDLVHIHGCWLPLQLITAIACRKSGVPFIATFHGMLEPWIFRAKGVLNFLNKLLYFYLLLKPRYINASGLHAITLGEKQNLQKLFPDNVVVEIPNAVDLNQFKIKPSMAAEKYIFFIGRIHPKKGVHLLLKAFEAADLGDEWELVIAGPNESSEYFDSLVEFVCENSLSERVRFIGPVYNDEKLDWYRRSWVTVVPSFSEVVGLVNLEAAACYSPTITTYECGLLDWEEGGGVLIHPEVESLTNALIAVSRWGEDERYSRGLASFNLIKRKYSWDVVSQQWHQFYSKVIDF